jgi:hypothetical protein
LKLKLKPKLPPKKNGKGISRDSLGLKPQGGVGNSRFKIQKLKVYFDFCILNFE